MFILDYMLMKILGSCRGPDPAVDEFQGSYLVFVGAGSNSFDVITKAVK